MDLVQFLQLTSAISTIGLVYVLYLKWRDSHHNSAAD